LAGWRSLVSETPTTAMLLGLNKGAKSKGDLLFLRKRPARMGGWSQDQHSLI
jgi:hypothetical protein